jgi:hypothetical protein
MASINGFGGAFVRANDPEALYRWSERHLGLMMSEGFSRFPPRRNALRSSSPPSAKAMNASSDTRRDSSRSPERRPRRHDGRSGGHKPSNKK